MCNKCNSVASFILGALLGAAVGVLYAPAKGETTRKKVKKWAKDTYEDGKDELAERTQELREKFAAKAESAKEKAGELKDLAVEKATAIKSQVQEKLEALREKTTNKPENTAKK